MSSFHVDPPPGSSCRRSLEPAATGSLPTGYRPRAVLEFRILGPLEVVGDDGPIRLGGPRQRATLAILLLNANRVVPIERLADDLYAGRPPVTAVTQVQRQVSELRRALGSAGRDRDAAARLPAAPRATRTLDLARFERLTAEAERRAAGATTPRRRALLREALGLWRGPPLADLAYEPFARAAVERLEELRLAALEERIEAELALGRHAGARRRARGARRRASAARAPPRPADARALPRGPAGRGARGLPRDAAGARRELRDRAVGAAAGARAGDPDATTPRSSSEPRRRADARGAVLVGARRATIASAALVELAALAARPSSSSRGSSRTRTSSPRRGRRGRCRTGRRARTAAFTTDDPAADLVRLATRQRRRPRARRRAARARRRRGSRRRSRSCSSARPPTSPCSRAPASTPAARVYVPFGGGEHDWAALELGAWLASATGAPLRLVGTRADPGSGRRDASRLLADASLAVQRVVGVDAEPVLADAGRARRRRRRRGPRRGRPLAALAPRGHRRRPRARSSATRARPCCSCTAARARAGSRRARAARASPGRSA